MNQEKLLPVEPPPIQPVFFYISEINPQDDKTIKQSSIDQFLLQSRQYLGLDNKAKY